MVLPFSIFLTSVYKPDLVILQLFANDIFEDNGKIIMKFTKRNDGREPEGKEFSFYIAIASPTLKYSLIAKWKKENYIFDKSRNSNPSERFIFEAFRIESKKLVFSFGKTKDEAVRELNYVAYNLDKS